MKTWMFLILLSLASQSVFAVNLQKFHFSNSPVFATVEDGLLSDGFITTDYKFIFVGSYNYVRAPFIEVDGNQRSDAIVEWMHTLNIGGAYRFSDKFQVGLSTFLTYEEAVGEYEQESKQKFALGDTTIDFKYKFYEKNKFAIAFTPRLLVPTGDEKYYTSNGDLGYYLGFALDKAFSFFQLAINLGHKENTGAVYEELDHTSQFHFSVGALIPLVGPFDLTAEFFRDTPYDSDNEQIPSEINAGLRYSTNSEEAYFAGVGSGSLQESESTDLRIYAGYKMFPGSEKSAKVRGEEKKFGRFYKLFDIYYKTGSSIIKDGQEEKLDEMVANFKDDPFISKIVVEGYSSRLGSDKLNKELSQKRAKRVTKYLIDRGVAEDILEYVSYGSSKADKKELNKDEDRKVMFRIYRRK